MLVVNKVECFFFQRIYMEMDFCFQRRESPLFLTTKMVNVTLRANQQLLYRGVTIHIPCDSIRFPLFRFYYVNASSSNRERKNHSRLVRRHVWEPDKERVAHGLPYLEILKGWLKDSIFTRQHKMAPELVSKTHILKSSGFWFNSIITHQGHPGKGVQK